MPLVVLGAVEHRQGGLVELTAERMKSSGNTLSPWMARRDDPARTAGASRLHREGCKITPCKNGARLA